MLVYLLIDFSSDFMEQVFILNEDVLLKDGFVGKILKLSFKLQKDEICVKLLYVIKK